MGHLFKRTGSLLKTTVSGHLAKCPDFANCCEGGLPSSVTIVGGGNCYSLINGTYALTPSGFDSCTAVYTESFTLPANPCTDGSHCHSASVNVGFPDGIVTVYYYPSGIEIQAVLSNVDNSVDVTIAVNMAGYYVNTGGSCTERIGVAGMSATWSRTTCRSGTFTESSVSDPGYSSARPYSVSLSW